MNILLINPRVEGLYSEWDISGAKSYSVPLGLLSLASVLRKEHKVTIKDLQAGMDLYATELWDYNLVGITAMSIGWSSANMIAREIKTTGLDIKKIIGGNHYSATGDLGDFDEGYKGEGEKYFYKYDTLDDLPFPAWDLVDIEKYTRLSMFGTKKKKSIGLVTSRGCPYQCIFCSKAVFGSKYRFFSAGYVLEMMKELELNYGITDFLFYDDIFVGNKDRLEEFCWNIPLHYTWSCCARVDMVDLPTLKMMKQAGCWMIEYGIESGSQGILDILKKGIKLDQIEQAIRQTRQAGILSKGNFIFGNPCEDRFSMQMTIDFAKRLKLDLFQQTFMTPLPGSKLYEDRNKRGTYTGEYNTLKINFVSYGTSKEELLKYSKKAWRVFYLRLRTLRLIKYIGIRKFVKAIGIFFKTIWR